MENLPTNVIQMIFAANIKIWPVLRLTCKRFLKISKTDFVMRRIVETSHMNKFFKKRVLEKYNIYNELLAMSKIHYDLYYGFKGPLLGVTDPSFRVQTFYGTFNVRPANGSRAIFGDILVSPFIVYKNSFWRRGEIATVRSYIKHIHSLTDFSNCKEGPFDMLRCDRNSYLTRFLNFIEFHSSRINDYLILTGAATFTLLLLCNKYLKKEKN